MQELPDTRRSLLLQLRDGCSDAWSEFLDIYERAIYLFCRRRGLQDTDALDVTQEVLVAVHRRIEDWDGDLSKRPFRGWLFRVARNIAVNKYLEQSKRAASGDSRVAKMLAELPASREAEEAAFMLECRRSAMAWAAQQVRTKVQENSWLAFWRTAVEGVKAEHVATELGLTVGSVYTAKCRVFARIKAIVAQLDDETIMIRGDLSP